MHVATYVFDVWKFVLCILLAIENETILDAMRHFEEKTCIRFQLIPYGKLQYGAIFARGTCG